jgi:hypothetical protein
MKLIYQFLFIVVENVLAWINYATRLRLVHKIILTSISHHYPLIESYYYLILWPTSIFSFERDIFLLSGHLC